MPAARRRPTRTPQREQGSWSVPGRKQGEVFADQRFYDLGIRFVVPRYEELHESILSALDVPHEAPFEVVDLGIGTGELSIKILRRWPNARIMGIDQSGDMLEVAKRKLSGYPDRVRFEQLSFTRMKKRGAAFDAVVSCLSVHHLTGPEKARLFKVVYDSLAPGGVFVNGDYVKANAPQLAKLYHRLWMNHMRGSGLSEEEIERVERHGHLDRPSTLDEQLEWMRDAGFDGVECLWKYYDDAVMVGLKPSKRR